MNLEDELARKEKFLQLFCVDQLLGYMEGQEYQKEKGYSLIFWLEDRVG